MVLVGHSMGGRAALGAAGAPNVVAVCALAPWLDGSDPVHQLDGRTVLIAHGDRERYTDPRESYAYALRAKQRGVRICRFDVPGAGHFMISRAGDWHRIVRRFVLGVLGIEPEDPVIANALRQPAASGLRSSAVRHRMKGSTRSMGARMTEPADGGRDRLRRRRADRRLPAATPLRRDPLRGRRPARRARAHPRADHLATATPRYVDSGFIVHNTRTYPNLLRLFGELGVATQDSEMSMSVRCEGCGLEYAGARRLGGLFPQPSNLARPRYLRMLGEVLRFHRHARRVLADERGRRRRTLGAFLAVGGYSRYFTEHFMLPVVSAVWSAG